MSRSPLARPGALRLGAAALAVVALGLSACSSDDEPAADAPTTTKAEADAPSTTADATPASTDASEEYCDLAKELNEQEELPSTEQLERYQSLAPEAVSEPVAVVVEAFAAADGDPSKVFGDSDAAEAIQELSAYEAEACGLEPPQDPDVTTIDPEATRVDVTADEYSFGFDAPTEAGRYSFVMQNEGAEPHLLILLQLEPGSSLEDAMASEGEEGVAASFESGVAAPGAEAVVTADLTAGDWVVICPIPDAEGTTHVAHGMVEEFTVS